MCGIAGVAGRTPEALRPLRAMTAALRHRGPDDEGYLLADSVSGRTQAWGGADTVAAAGLPRLPETPAPGIDVGLGNRRLAIIDLSPAGHQPMGSSDGRVWVTYNGEIFNYVELREELKALGHAFRTASDTEVLLAAYAQWGAHALSRFNGMWAFALYDARERRLFCARDRFGVKPFHYHATSGFFAFASEIKGLLAHPGVPRRPDEATLAAFLVQGALHEDENTFYDGIHSLPGGHQLSLDLVSGALEVRRWYTLPEPREQPSDPREIRDLLADSVRLRLRSDVDVGTCLSGGLDSSSIVALTARLRDHDGRGRHRSFSIVYPDPGLDESAHVCAVVAATGVEGARATPTSAELLADLPALVRHHDEPFPSASVYSQFRVMKMAREAGVPVLLDGQGGDEVLAGYHYHYGPYLADVALRRGLPTALRAAGQARRVTGRSWGFLLGALAYHAVPLPAAVQAWAVRRHATQGRIPHRLLARDYAAGKGAPAVERHRRRPGLHAELRADILQTSLPVLLRYEDRNSMAFSVEARTPFLDYRLVERAQAVPASDLIHDGWTKAILREAMAGVVPDTILRRADKLGFPTPEKRWLCELAPQVREWLGHDSQLGPRLDATGLRAWLSLGGAELAGRPGLWRLVSAELWLRQLQGAGTNGR
jgi:asparagine synthase (glutamine-hydrolysing)